MNRCYSPLKAFVIPVRRNKIGDVVEGVTRNGKPEYKVCSYNCDHIERDRSGVWRPVYDSFISGASGDWSSDYIEIACGKCIGCRLRHAEEWSIRCLLEAERHTDNVFLTLTYDDDHIPYSVDENGEFQKSLCKRDLQLFWKRLRKALPDIKIRYFACGEYGPKTLRPHYHAIVFGLRLDDKKFYRRSPLGDNYFTSEFITNIWQNGAVIVGDVTKESCAYTARYVIKKAQDDTLSELYSVLNIQEEFIVMSRKPGIAADVYLDDPSFDSFDRHYIGTDTGSVSYTAPRYFRKLGERRAAGEGDSSYFADRLHRGWIADDHQEAVKEVIKNGTDLNYIEYLEMLEGKKLREIQSLKRDKL